MLATPNQIIVKSHFYEENVEQYGENHGLAILHHNNKIGIIRTWSTTNSVATDDNLGDINWNKKEDWIWLGSLEDFQTKVKNEEDIKFNGRKMQNNDCDYVYIKKLYSLFVEWTVNRQPQCEHCPCDNSEKWFD